MGSWILNANLVLGLADWIWKGVAYFALYYEYCVWCEGLCLARDKERECM
jgi:hypothetical protein